MGKEKSVNVISKEGKVYFRALGPFETEDEGYRYIKEEFSLPVPFLDRTNYAVDYGVAGYVAMTLDDNFALIAIPKELTIEQKTATLEESKKLEDRVLYIYSFRENNQFRTIGLENGFSNNLEMICSELGEKEVVREKRIVKEKKL